MNEMVKQYLATALWTNEELDREFSIYDFSKSSIKKATKDCDRFYELVSQLENNDIDLGELGHDFWLTRNRHGAGFWDRGYGLLGEQLTEISHQFGEINIYLGNNNKIEIE